MYNQVFADIEIEDQTIGYYSSIVIRQQFNAHHQFTIRIKYDVWEKTGTFKVSNAQKLIGKSTTIKLKQANDLAVAYEFRGIICELSMEQSDNFSSDLVLKGYSPTILLESGPHLLSFYKKGLKDIAGQLTKPVADSSCPVNISPQYTAPITYICQYRESTFHFLNRLSSDFGEWFYYDGKELFFGKPGSFPDIDITYGEDTHNIQVTLRVLPMSFSSYAYLSKDDKLVSSKAPSSVDGLDEFAEFALKESNKIFAEPVSFPVRQRVQSKSDLDTFVKKHKAAMAADLKVLNGSSDNPALCIGAVASVKFSRREDSAFVKEEHGKFLITAIEHHVTENGKYYNTFEAIPSGLEIIPVKNIVMPIAEPQIATVKDNKDPDNMGRVRVQMLWQQENNDMTDWLRVMTPDAGGANDGAKNRGMVCIPEKGDQVLVCFRYNDPDRPFVLGSIFHGKTGGGGGDANKSKSITTRTGSTLTFDEGVRSIVLQTDATNNLKIEKTGDKISITAATEIKFTTGSSSITMNTDGTITIQGINIHVKGVNLDIVGAKDESASGITIDPENISVIGKTTCKVAGGDELNMGSNGKVGIVGKNELNAGSDGPVNIVAKGETAIQGAKVNLN